MKKALGLLALSGVSILALSPAAAAQDTVELVATLNGANEVGDPGDPDGSGTATITVDAVNTQVCFKISVAGIGTVTAGHIHAGGAGTNGDVEIDFNLDSTLTEGCVNSDTATIASMLNTPQLFYVNVHNEEFPAGAIRGQLAAPVVAAADDETAAVETTATDTTADATADADAAESTLAYTGDITGVLAVAGAALVAGGAALVIAGRRNN